MKSRRCGVFESRRSGWTKLKPSDLMDKCLSQNRGAYSIVCGVETHLGGSFGCAGNCVSATTGLMRLPRCSDLPGPLQEV
jgi:hypothetical protein